MHSEVLTQTDTLQIFSQHYHVGKIRSGLQCIIPRIKFLKKDFLKTPNAAYKLYFRCTVRPNKSIFTRTLYILNFKKIHVIYENFLHTLKRMDLCLKGLQMPGFIYLPNILLEEQLKR